MKKKIIIVGNGIAAEIVYGVLSRDKRFEIAAFTVHQNYMTFEKLFNLPVVALENLLNDYSPASHHVVMAVGYSNINQNREQLFNTLISHGYDIMSYLHPNATILSDNIGQGVFIMPGAVIEPHATIENNTVIWSNATIAHHVIVREHAWIASGTVIAGEALIGRNSFLGVNATVVNKISIGSYNIIGAGTLVSKDTPNNTVMLARSGEKHRFDSQSYSRFYQS